MIFIIFARRTYCRVTQWFKVKQNFLKTWLCIPCEQSGRNRGIPFDLSDKCKLQSCRKSEKKRSLKKKILLFLHQFLIMTWQENLCPSVVCNTEIVIWGFTCSWWCWYFWWLRVMPYAWKPGFFRFLKIPIQILSNI